MMYLKAFEWAQGKLFCLIHTAKGAGIMAAAVGDLNDQTACLGRRAINAAEITHEHFLLWINVNNLLYHIFCVK